MIALDSRGADGGGGGGGGGVRDNGPLVLSQHDDRVYRHITMPNQMQVLLIHDPKADKEAAAMDVRVGSLCDPPNLLGLAHFCEHMLFLGSGKYPDEKSYREFIGSCGGGHNAYTACERTNFYFDVTAGNLSEALDRFSRFFIDPLFTESATNREIRAVDSEHASYLQNDAWRVMQVLKSISSKDHPWHQFNVGNVETLGDDPQKGGVDIRTELLKFHAKYYSANMMRLVVLGRHGLDELQEMVVDMFSPVINSNAPRPAFPGMQSFGPGQVKRRLNIVPVMETQQLIVIWPIPPLTAHFRSKPGGYVGRLLGYECSGSLLSMLKHKGWANHLFSHQSYSCSEWSTFTAVVSCTDSGMEHVDEIVTLLYQYINTVREEGLQEWIQLERKRLWDLYFRFASKSAPMQYVSDLAGSMQDMPPDLSVAGDRLVFEHDAEMVEEVLSRMVSSNMLLIVVDKRFKGKTDKMEPWYGTDYSVESLPEKLLQSWETCGKNPDMRLPGPNPFIPNDFVLREAPSSSVPPTSPGDIPSPPLLIRDDPLCRLWHKTDATYNMPKLNVYVRMVTPVVYESPESSVMATLMTSLLLEDMRNELYLAQATGLSVNFYANKNDLQLYMTGYNDKMAMLLNRVVERMTKFTAELGHDDNGRRQTQEQDDDDRKSGGGSSIDNGDGDGNDLDEQTQKEKKEEEKDKEKVEENGEAGTVTTFARLREELKKQVESRAYNNPTAHAGEYTITSLLNRQWTDQELLRALEGPGITPAAMRLFVPRVLDMLYVEMLVHGNATDAEAHELASAIVNGIGFRPLPKVLFPQDRVVDLRGYGPRIPTQKQKQKQKQPDKERNEERAAAAAAGITVAKMEPTRNTSVSPSTTTTTTTTTASEVECTIEAGRGSGTTKPSKPGMCEAMQRGFAVGPAQASDTPEQPLYPEYRRSAVCPNPDEINNAVQLSFQLCLDDGGRNTALRSLLLHLMKDNFFDQLRTKEQLGYIVQVYGANYGANVMHMAFVIQSSEKAPAYLDERIEAFIAGFRQTLMATTPEMFASSVSARRQLMLKKCERLASETFLHWGQISQRTYDFSRRVGIADALAELTLPDVIDFFDLYLAIDAPERRKIAGWAHGAKYTAPLLEKQQGSEASSGDDRDVKGGAGDGSDEACKVENRLDSAIEKQENVMGNVNGGDGGTKDALTWTTAALKDVEAEDCDAEDEKEGGAAGNWSSSALSEGGGAEEGNRDTGECSCSCSCGRGEREEAETVWIEGAKSQGSGYVGNDGEDVQEGGEISGGREEKMTEEREQRMTSVLGDEEQNTQRENTESGGGDHDGGDGEGDGDGYGDILITGGGEEQDGGEPTMQQQERRQRQQQQQQQLEWQGQNKAEATPKRVQRRVISIEDCDDFRRSMPLFPALIPRKIKMVMDAADAAPGASAAHRAEAAVL